MASQSAEPFYARSGHGRPDRLDGFAASYHDTLLLVARVVLGLIFVLSGYGKLMGLGAFAASLAAHGVPAASLMAALGAAVEFFGGVFVVLGLASRYAALLMILFV